MTVADFTQELGSDFFLFSDSVSVFDSDGRGVKLRDFSLSDKDGVGFDVDFVDIGFEIESETLLLSDGEEIGSIVFSNNFPI